MRIFTGALVTETCTFSPIPTRLEDFETAAGGRLLGALVRDTLEDFRAEAEAQGCVVMAGFAAGAMPAGPTLAAAYATLKSQLLRSLELALPVDAVCLFLHGAMVAEDEDDCEGDILAEVRARVGPDIPIGVLIDPHAHLSVRMVDNADAIIAFKEWPHIDIPDRARDAMRVTIAAARGEIRPATAVHDCRMIDFFHTREQPMRAVVERLRSLEQSGEVVSASIIHGFPFGDTFDTGTKVLVITNGDAGLAAKHAETIGTEVYGLRGQAHAQHLTVAAGVEAALGSRRLPVVVADTADAPGGGAPGDETYILQALRAAGAERVAVAYVHDPAMVDLAFSLGEGAVFRTSLGSARTGTQMHVDAVVAGLFPEASVIESGQPCAVGDIALIRSGEMEILVSRLRPVALTAQHFEAFGIDPAQRKIIVVKSVNNFRAGFESLDPEFVYICGPGVLDTSLQSLNFAKVKRPTWPLDT